MSLARRHVMERVDFDKYRIEPADEARIISPWEAMPAAEKFLRGGELVEGLSLPFPGLEHLVRFRPGKITLWSGYAGHGKTQLLKLLMNYALRAKHKVCLASMEETPDETLLDMAVQAIQKKPTPDDLRRYCEWSVDKLWLYDQQGRAKFERMIGVMNYAAKVLGCSHFVIDSLMRLGVSRDDYDAQRIFINELGAQARISNIHVHLVAHSRKGNAGEEHLPSMYDIRGAADIADQADGVMVMWRNKVEAHKRKPGDPDGLLRVCKQRRQMPNWLGSIKLWMEPGSGQFMIEKDRAPLRLMT